MPTGKPKVLMAEDNPQLLGLAVKALSRTCDVTALNLSETEVPSTETVEATADAVAQRIRQSIEGGSVDLLLLDFETQRPDAEGRSVTIMTAADYLALLQNETTNATEGIAIWIITGGDARRVQSALTASEVHADKIIMKSIPLTDIRGLIESHFSKPTA